jgi:hypothetical protein
MAKKLKKSLVKSFLMVKIPLVLAVHVVKLLNVKSYLVPLILDRLKLNIISDGFCHSIGSHLMNIKYLVILSVTFSSTAFSQELPPAQTVFLSKIHLFNLNYYLKKQ